MAKGNIITRFVESIAERLKGTSDQSVAELSDKKINAKHGYNGTSRYIGSVSFNGEKNLGEVGPIKDYTIDYVAIRKRSWQLYLESEIAQIVFGKLITSVIGKGLKMQLEPVKEVLENSGINVDLEKFAKSVESRFNLWASTKMPDYSNMQTLNAISREAFKNVQVGGDVLVVLRVVKGNVKVQIIDGELVVNPVVTSAASAFATANGNKIVHGVEINAKGEHVAYHVRKTNGMGEYTYETERIAAKGARSGMTMAYMYYGHKYRIDSVRGMPLLSVVMETTKKLERYKEATLGSAEERQKIAYTIEHQVFSSGESPLWGEMATVTSDGNPEDDVARFDTGEQVANKVTATTNKQTFNMPIGAQMKAVESKNELYFKDFYEILLTLITASLDMPVDVALSRYNNSFSASRAALGDWSNVLVTKRELHNDGFYAPIVALYLYLEVLKGTIVAPGYIDAYNEGDEMVLAAYNKARFTGMGVPHIDPLKEVKAEREKLGAAGANVPLTTVEAATEALNGGDSESNIEQFARELDTIKKLKIEPSAPPLDPNKQVANNQNNNGEA